jgi:subtilisin family serine protease
MDTGLDWSHPDLGANVRLNTAEIAGNGLDDDANGYIDDVRGWDFGNNDADARPHTTLEQGLDVGFHGTHCAGIASAVTNNGVGVAGAGYHCRLLPLKIVNSNSEFTDAAITEAFLYAIDNGADVISMSFGGPDEGGAAAFFQTLVDDATAAGIVCVAAAGNNNDASLMYPAACSGVISVGATNSSGQRASFSTYGSWITVNAPGEHIWSTIQSNYSFDFLTMLLYQLLYEYDGTNPYMYCDGTSMACPLVAGVCGLIRSAAPGLSPAAVRQVLIDTGDDITYDQPIGVKVNALAAVQSLPTTGAEGAPPPALQVVCAPNPFNPNVTVTFALLTGGSARLEVFDAAGRRVRTLVDAARPEGRHTVIWDGRDAAGHEVAAGVYLVRLQAGGEFRRSKIALVK